MSLGIVRKRPNAEKDERGAKQRRVSVNDGGEIGTLREVYSNGPGTDIERIKPTKGLPATMADMLLCF